MATSGNNNQANSSSSESNEFFESSEIIQSAQNFDDGLVPMDDDELFLTAPEEILNQARIEMGLKELQGGNCFSKNGNPRWREAYITMAVRGGGR